MPKLWLAKGIDHNEPFDDLRAEVLASNLRTAVYRAADALFPQAARRATRIGDEYEIRICRIKDGA